MKKRKMLSDENAQALSFDFLIAIGIMLGTILFAYYALSVATTSYYGESTKMYPLADRVSEMLIKDPGEPTDWVSDWTIGNYSDVERIGLVNVSSIPNVLNRTKLNTLMINFSYPDNKTWWEFGEKVVGSTKYENATVALGLKGNSSLGYRGYDCYMQLTPTNKSSFNKSMADEHFEDNVMVVGDVVVVERIVIVPIIKENMDYDYDYYKLKMWMW